MLRGQNSLGRVWGRASWLPHHGGQSPPSSRPTAIRSTQGNVSHAMNRTGAGAGRGQVQRTRAWRRQHNAFRPSFNGVNHGDAAHGSSVSLRDGTAAPRGTAGSRKVRWVPAGSAMWDGQAGQAGLGSSGSARRGPAGGHGAGNRGGPEADMPMAAAGNALGDRESAVPVRRMSVPARCGRHGDGRSRMGPPGGMRRYEVAAHRGVGRASWRRPHDRRLGRVRDRRRTDGAAPSAARPFGGGGTDGRRNLGGGGSAAAASGAVHGRLRRRRPMEEAHMAAAATWAAAEATWAAAGAGPSLRCRSSSGPRPISGLLERFPTGRGGLILGTNLRRQA